MSMAICCVLPARERFRPADAGAVALCIKEQVAYSRYGSETIVIGALEGGFSGINYQRVSPFLPLLLGQSKAYSLACQKHFKKNPPKLLEVHNRAKLFLDLQKAMPNVPCALFLHNDPQGMEACHTAKQRQLILDKASYIYCVSDYVRQRFLEGLTGSIEKVQVVYNGVDIPEVIHQKQKIITYAGRLIPEKGILELVKAMAVLLPKYPSWHFNVIGAYGFGRPLGATDFEQQLFLEAKPAEAQIAFLGHQPQTSVIHKLEESSLVIVPSTGIEAFGRVAIEAMAQGCAVITSVSGGLKEITADTPYYVEQITTESLIEAVDSLLKDEQLLQQAQVWSRQQVQRFSLKEQLNSLDNVRAILLGEGE